jgi:hypothetical protein
MTTVYPTGLVTLLLPLGAIAATNLLRKISPLRRTNARSVTSPEGDRLPEILASVTEASVGLVTFSGPVVVKMVTAASGVMRLRANCDHDRALPLPLPLSTGVPRENAVNAPAPPLEEMVTATVSTRKMVVISVLAPKTGRATSTFLASTSRSMVRALMATPVVTPTLLPRPLRLHRLLVPWTLRSLHR